MFGNLAYHLKVGTKHKLSFNNRKYTLKTILSKHIWELKNSIKDFSINWEILAQTKTNSI